MGPFIKMPNQSFVYVIDQQFEHVYTQVGVLPQNDLQHDSKADLPTFIYEINENFMYKKPGQAIIIYLTSHLTVGNVHTKGAAKIGALFTISILLYSITH